MGESRQVFVRGRKAGAGVAAGFLTAAPRRLRGLYFVLIILSGVTRGCYTVISVGLFSPQTANFSADKELNSPRGGLKSLKQGRVAWKEETALRSPTAALHN